MSRHYGTYAEFGISFKTALMPFARLKSQPLEGSRSPVIDTPTLARDYRCVIVRESKFAMSIPEANAQSRS